MSTFDEASLVFIPSGYKTSKAYSVKPTDGTGDLTFTRSNDTATRVGPDGLIEKVRTNLVLQSEDFTTTWATNAAPTITANTTVAPDGTTTADTIASSGASSGAYQVPTVASGVEYSFSVYVKNITSATNILLGCDLSPSNGTLNFNAVTGSITSTGAGITGSSVTDAGSGWYRVSGTYVSTATANTFIVFGQSGMTFAVWGAQLETGVTTAYIGPTLAAAVSVGPVANVPRLDYLGSSCPRLLLEPQRTNLFPYSNYFGTDWVLTAATITTNATTSPEGVDNASLYTSSNATNAITDTITAANGTYTLSAFFKRDATDNVRMNFSDGATGEIRYVFNLTDETSTLTKSGGTISNYSADFENYGNGWYRLYITATKNSGTAIAAYFETDNETGSFYLYGAQLEAGSHITSLIPSYGAAVTRGVDACSKTGISSLIGSAAGTIYVEFSALANDLSERRIALSDGTTGNVARVGYTNTSNRILAVLYNGTNQCVLAYDDADITQTQKVAFTWAANDFALFVNGVKRSSDVSGTTFAANTLTAINFNEGDGAGNNWYGDVDQLLLFKSRLSDSDLAALTA